MPAGSEAVVPPAVGTGMADRVRAFDWSKTSLGPMDRWPPALRAAVGICLNSRFPMMIWWGPDLINIYNDAYAPMLGKKHPDALGQSGRDVWSDVWPAVQGQVETVLSRGEATFTERGHLVVDRNGFPEDAWFTYSYSPIPDDRGGIGGLFNTCHEDTAQVLGERERDRLLEQQRQADQRARTILESITDAFFALDREWRFTYLNPQGQQVLDLTPDQVLGMSIWDVYPGLRESEFGQAYERTVAEQVATSFTSYFPEHDRYYEVHAYPAPDGGVSVYFSNATERERADRTLREAKAAAEANLARWQTVIASMTEGVILADKAGNLVEWNRTALDMHGYVNAEDARRKLTELTPAFQAFTTDGELVPFERWPMSRLLGGETFKDWELRVHRSDVELDRVISYSGTNVSNGDDPAGLVMLTLHDVTDERRAQRSMWESGEQLRLIMASVKDHGIFTLDLDGKVTNWNVGAERVFGFSAEEMLGKQADILFTPEDRGTGRPAIEMLLAAGGGKDGVAEDTRFHMRKDGSRFFSGGSMEGLRDEAGHLRGYVKVVRDVTERMQAEEARRQNEELNKAVLAALDEGISLHDERGTIIMANASAERILGLTLDQMLGVDSMDPRWQSLAEDGSSLPGEGHPPQVAVRTGRPVKNMVMAVRHASGSLVWVSVNAVPLRDPATGQITGAVTSFFDITDRREAEQERERLYDREREARADAERAGRMKDEFLATLSHELRTPLNAILGWSQIIRGSNNDPEDVYQGIEVIERNARAQSQIIEDLLDMSRIISGKVRLDVQRLDLPAIAQASIATVRPTAEVKGVRLTSVIDPLHDVVVTGDSNRMQQVLWNLLTNAVKFTPRGGQVQLLLERVNSHLEISVIDTGEGIRQEFLPFVFDRFRQADASTTRRHGGLGLGLSIVKQLSELHGGSVRVKSAGPGRGSTFIVSLPLTVAHPETVAEPERRHPTAALPLSGSEGACVQIEGVRVLVIDDEPDARVLVKRLLEDCRAIVTVTDSAEEVVRRIATKEFDVLVSDVGMPIEDGYSLIRRVRALGKERGGDIPAIALTAYARAEDRVRAVSAGFQMHVSKPVEAVELVTMVAGAAGRTGQA